MSDSGHRRSRRVDCAPSRNPGVMMSEPVVIVGAGQAGFETATSLRSKGYTGDITILGDEENVPYQRPPLSKAYLKGDSDPESVALRPRDYFASHRIDLHCSRRVTDIDRQMHEVELD